MKQVRNEEAGHAGRVWPFAEGSASTIITVFCLLVVVALLWYFIPSLLTGFGLLLGASLFLLILYFFRDPDRPIIDVPGQVMAPGDGEVIEIVREHESLYLHEEVIRISIFLSITDVHVQRVPLGGLVTLVEHRPGKFVQAFRPEASAVNESIASITESEYGRVLFKQIAGILARRCVNRLRPGEYVGTGQRFGLIKFSSRVDLCLPLSAKLLVQVGDRIMGGLTPIARLQP